MKKATEQTEPSQAALDEMPEIDEQRFRRRPGRGHHVGRSVGEGRVVDDAKKAAGS